MKAIVNVSVCPLYASPSRDCTLEDEALYGMVVDILEAVAPGWYRIRTPYRYEGIVPGEDLLLGDERAAAWQVRPKVTPLHKHFCDVLSAPKVQGHWMQSLPMGGQVCPVGTPEDGWQKVALADGREGYAPAGILAPFPTAPVCPDEAGLRRALVDTALRYQGSPYRWGGKTPLGIDCSGLVSMAYMLCGVTIYRDARIQEGFPIHEIPLEAVKPGDLLFFPGHVAMYLGEGKYCHCTARSGDDGFTVNSLDPQAPDYRADLAGQISRVGSYF